MGSVTEKNSINNIQNFFEDINNPSETYYLFVGQTLPWANDSQPPISNTSLISYEHSLYHDMVYGKLITNNNIAYLIQNYQWANGTVYTPYDIYDPNLFSEPFYTVTENYNVYKCLDNNYGALSTVQPALTPLSGSFSTSDGYTWKYMFSVDSTSNGIFTTNTFIPVTPNTFVSNNAIPGSLDITRVSNGGSNYETFTMGQVRNVINENSIQLQANATALDGFFVGCSIYLNSGYGAGQIREIAEYIGDTQTIYTTTPFNTSVNLQLSSGNGSFIIGDTVQQNISSIGFLFQQGFFNPGDTIVQVDVQASGSLISANSEVIQVTRLSGNAFNIIAPNNSLFYYPIIDTTQASISQPGTVSITSGSNTLTAVAGANLVNSYAIGSYIQVGTNSNTNVRRVTFSNSSTIKVSYPFLNTLVANVHSRVPYAIEPTSIAILQANGKITQSNMNSTIIEFGNTSVNNGIFILGETVKEFNANGVDQVSNGIVSFVNTSTVILSSIQGSFVQGLLMIGQASGLQAQINNVKSYPNITLDNVSGEFITGANVFSYYANGIQAGTGLLIGTVTSPSDTTSYIVSPTVSFSGDGEGALAYSVVNTALNGTYPIQSIVMINPGNNYTQALATISGNSQWGSGASALPIIAPVEGHGSDAYTELGALWAGISMTFDTTSNELFDIPGYGSYRKYGILKNPLFNQVTGYIGTPWVLNLETVPTNSNTFLVGEILIQPSTNAVGTVVFANSSQVSVNNWSGSFTTNVSVNTQIYGFKSLAQANVVTTAPNFFTLSQNSTAIYQLPLGSSGPSASLIDVNSNSQITLANVTGKFLANSIVYTPDSFDYVPLSNLAISNGHQDMTSSFGLRFNQTQRVTISTSTPTFFQVGEYAIQMSQNGPLAQGLVISNTSDIDISFTPNYGSMTPGTQITDANTQANGVVIWSNSTYVKVTDVQGVFNSGDQISTLTGNGVITSIYPVIVLSDVSPQTGMQQGPGLAYTIVGNTSNAQGLSLIANTITQPDLVRNSGEVLYYNTIPPFARSLTSKEKLNLVLQF